MRILNKIYTFNLSKKLEKLSAFFYSKRIIHSNQKTAFLEMRIGKDGRRLFLLSSLLISVGYKVAIYLSIREFFQLDRIGAQLFLYNKSVFCVSKKKHLETCAVLLSDQEETLREYHEKGGIGKSLLIDYIFKSAKETYHFTDGLFYPIHFHPAYLSNKIEKKILASCKIEKDIAVFFAGNISSEYECLAVRQVKGHAVNDRMEIFRFLNDQCKELIFLPDSLENLQQNMNAGALKNKIVLVNINHWKIPPEFYFQILSRSAYFLYMPGFWQPYCHNMYESLACGCIPILQFPEIFSPAFEDEKNAVVYFSLAELKEKLKRIVSSHLFKTDGSETKKLQKKVIEYYAQFCSFTSFAQGLKTKAKKIYTLPSAANTVPQNYEKDEQ